MAMDWDKGILETIQIVYPQGGIYKSADIACAPSITTRRSRSGSKRNASINAFSSSSRSYGRIQVNVTCNQLEMGLLNDTHWDTGANNYSNYTKPIRRSPDS